MTTHKHSSLIACFLLLLPAAPLLAEEPTPDMSGKKELAMQHCPSTVAGATTKVEDIADGVIVTVQAPDILAQQEIRGRAQFQLEIVDQPERSSIEHTGFGTGSGKYGFCPGMMANTSLEAKWIPDGVIMTIRADQKSDVARLQKSTHKRARALAKRPHLRPATS